MKSKKEETSSFNITDTSIIQKLDSLTPQEMERLNEMLEESMNELREKYKIKTGTGFDESNENKS